MSIPSPEIPENPEIFVRPCRGLEELGACVRLQAAVWGLAESEIVPRRSFVVASHIGGQVIGAFDPSRAGIASGVIGFAMALPALAPRSSPAAGVRPYLHSHMLAVEPGYRNRGIGRRLKLFQREEALARGIQHMEWTFDPLEIKNSYLNIHRLGAISRKYVSNMYGVSSSRLQGTLPTDRLFAEWWMDSARVRCAIEGKSFSSPPVEETVMVPREIGEWKTDQAGLERAFTIQRQNRERLERAFARGLAVTGYRVDGGNGVFELGRLDAPGASSP
ncbi:MAG TPA: GNAT family N-acetyltransferase [Acidobacteriaceae bacterium]|nr:GNAT family N-acetyltransferase [Acidobacteriaceae bacterium]